MSQIKSSSKIIIISLLGNFALFIAKIVVFLISRSPSLLAESIHSLADTLNQLLIFIGSKKGKLGPCHQYPMGQGRASYLFNILASVGVFAGAVYTVSHALGSMAHPYEKSPSNFYAFLVLIISGVVEGIIFLKALKEINSKRGKKPLFKYLKEADDPSILGILLEDGIAVLGVVIAFFGIFISQYMHSNIPDIISSLLIAASLLYMAFFLFKFNYRLLVGAKLPIEEETELANYISSYGHIDKLVNMQTEILAPNKVRLSVEVLLAQDFSQDHGEFINEFEKELMAKYKKLVLIDTEID